MSLGMFWTLVVATLLAYALGENDLGLALLGMSIFMLGVHELATAIRQRR